ncbi:MAG: hypothetical protein LBL59_00905 [Xanthomonadaceae bacterium]|nr:hypothetical protein [Xanthomonadaceae bacterium]
MAMVLGVALTIYGLMQQTWSLPRQWAPVLPWDSESALYRFIGVVVVSWMAFALIEAIFRLRTISSFLLVAVLVMVLTGNVLALLVVSGFILSSLVLGEWLLKIIGAGKHAQDGMNSFLTGAGAGGVGVGLLVYFPVNYPGVYGVLLLLPLLLRWKNGTIPKLVALSDYLENREPKTKSGVALGALMSAMALVHLIFALLPELGHDALGVHMLVSSTLYYQGGWAFDPLLYVYSLMPMLGDWIFSIGYMLSGETGTRVLNLSFAYLMAMQGHRLVRWLGGNTVQARLAMLLFLTTPLTFTETNSLHVEMVWGTYVVAGAMAVMRLVSDRDADAGGNLKLGGLFLGCALSAKVITLTMLPALVLFMLLRIRFWLNRQTVRPACIGLLLFIAPGSIPYVSSWIISGNPVFPFFNGIFKSPYFPPENFNNPQFNAGVTWDLFYRMVFDAPSYLEATVGAPGYQWLILLPAAIVASLCLRNWRALMLLAVAAISLVAVFSSQSYLRYIFPLFIYVCALASIGFGSVMSGRKAARILPVLALSITVLLNIVFFASATWTYRNIPLMALFNEHHRDQYLERRAPIRLAVKAINQVNTERTPVLFMTRQPLAGGLNANALFLNWYNLRLAQQVNAMKSIKDLANIMGNADSSHIILDDDWSDESHRALVREATMELFRFGPISVRRLLNEYRYMEEMLSSPELDDADAWTVFQGASVHDGVATVSVGAPITQTVPVTPGRRYYNQVLAKCDAQPAQGRVQINWLDKDGEFLGTDITVFPCGQDWERHGQTVRAPERAANAIVFGGSHGEKTIQLSEVSLK